MRRRGWRPRERALPAPGDWPCGSAPTFLFVMAGLVTAISINRALSLMNRVRRDTRLRRGPVMTVECDDASPSKFESQKMIDRDKPAAVDQKIQRPDRPHRRILK